MSAETNKTRNLAAPEEAVALQIRTLLFGAYDFGSALMRDSLRQLNLLPSQQPYNVYPWNYEGSETLHADLLLRNDSGAPVDWFLLQLRSATNPANVLAQRALMIQRNGYLIDSQTGEQIQRFSDLPVGAYYVSLQHRNHMGVMTAEPVPLGGGISPPLLDFSQTETATWGEYARLETNNLALLWPGDVNADGLVISSGGGNDSSALLAPILSSPENTTKSFSMVLRGYHAGDVNLDGNSIFSGTNNDLNLIKGVIAAHPGNIHNFLNYAIFRQLPLAGVQ